MDRMLSLVSLRRGAAHALIVIAMLCALPQLGTTAEATVCPAALARATRLLVVTTTSMAATRARAQLYERDAPTASWRVHGTATRAVVGRAGLGWALDQATASGSGEPTKHEGDGRTPAGVFRAGIAFGTERGRIASYLQLTPSTVCVDDVASPRYNEIVPVGHIDPHMSHERMGATVLYRQGLVIEHQTDRARRGGSCIFLHVWRGSGRPTAGCVAADEAVVRTVQSFFDGHPSAVAILPRHALQRYAHCGLPG